MWNEVCEGLCARCGGNCRVAVTGSEAAALLAGFAQAAGAREGEPVSCSCAGGTLILCAGEEEGADAVLVALAASDAKAAKEAAEQAGAAPVLPVLLGEGAREQCARLAEEGVYAVCCDPSKEEEAGALLRELLFSFPAAGLEIDLPDWMSVLPEESRIVAQILETVRALAPKLRSVRDLAAADGAFGGDVYCASFEADPATGKGRCRLETREGLFHRVLSEECGADVSDDLHLMAYIAALRDAKQFCDAFKNAVAAADAVGYGIAAGTENAVLGAPEFFRRGTRCGVRLKADAPAYHIIKVDVHSEVTPVSGEGERGEQLAKGILESYEKDSETLWDTDMFGKTFREMVQEGLREKQGGVPEEVRAKLRRALTRIVNEGKGGVLCILL